MAEVERELAAELDDGSPRAAKKRRKPVKLNSKTLEECRRRGWTAATVEKVLPIPGRKWGNKVDLFGGIDVVALTIGGPNFYCTWNDGNGPVRIASRVLGVLGIQTSSAADRAKHRDKLSGEPRMLDWLRCGNRLEVWSWARRKVKRGGTAVRYELVVDSASLVALDDDTPAIRWEQVT